MGKELGLSRSSPSCNSVASVVLAVCLCFLVSIQAAAAEEEEFYSFTPVPFLDIIKDLKPLFFGNQSDYFISTYEADAETARRVCQNLTDMTGKHFHLLILETAQEVTEIQSYLADMNISGIWTAGEKSFNDKGQISVFWVTAEGTQAMSFKDFRKGIHAISRERRSLMLASNDSSTFNENSTSSLLYPWLATQTSTNGGKCRIGKINPPCEPVQCNVTMPDCETTTPPCTIKEQRDCVINRPPCSAKCENCTIIPPVCVSKPRPCTVKIGECSSTRQPCSIFTPPCTTTRPECKVVQPPCEVTTPPPCTPKPNSKCVPSFSKNCTTVTKPCTVNKNNETVCPPAETVCDPSYKCPPPEVCQSPAIICPPPLIYCEPETTVCPDPITTCKPPTLYCPEPEVHCPEPEIVCSAPQAICSPPVVNCPGIITSCPAPLLDCPPAVTRCPDPIVTCTKPTPCEPEVTLPPPCTTEATTPTTTQRPCPGCGCIVMSKQHDFKWDITMCRKEFHFICEG